jgi:MoaA/NifB/PqqE/SkfB family radical SAM enzyme
VSPTFCVLPWIHLATHPNGGVSLCCRSNHTNSVSWAKKPGSSNLLLLDNETIADVMNSEKFIQVRTAMLNGEQPVECEGCWRDEHTGIKSKREYENERWAHIIPTLNLSPVLNEIRLVYVELRLGNVCNNACLTCNSYSSSKWYPDEKKISKELSWFKLRDLETFKWFEKTDFYQDLASKSTEVEEIYINGGEPTLIRAHFSYLSRLINDGTCKNVHLVYSLNMMDVPDALIELWRHFKRVTINASIDDVGERNYYIRYPTKWDQTLESMRKLSTIQNVDWHVTQTVSILNVHNLCELWNFLLSNFNKTPHHNYVLYPAYMSLAALPETVKARLTQQYKDKLPPSQYQELVAKLAVPYDENANLQAREFIAAVDRARNLNYTTYIPELDDIL